MSRAKRTRKARSATRRTRRYEKAVAAHVAYIVDQNERARFRRELNASDLPDAMKTVLGMLADPVGFVADKAREKIESDE